MSVTYRSRALLPGDYLYKYGEQNNTKDHCTTAQIMVSWSTLHHNDINFSETVKSKSQGLS